MLGADMCIDTKKKPARPPTQKKQDAQDLKGNAAIQEELMKKGALSASPEATEFREWCSAAEGMISEDGLDCSFEAGKSPMLTPQEFRAEKDVESIRKGMDAGPSLNAQRGPIIPAQDPREKFLNDVKHIDTIRSGGPLAALPHIRDGIARNKGYDVDLDSTRRDAEMLGSAWQFVEGGMMAGAGKTSRLPEKRGDHLTDKLTRQLETEGRPGVYLWPKGQGPVVE